MVREKLTRIYVTGVLRRRTTTGAAAPKSCVKQNFDAWPGAVRLTPIGGNIPQ